MPGVDGHLLCPSRGRQAQSIVNCGSGLPFNPSVSRDVANTGAGGQRPNRIGDGKLEDRTIDRWFDKTAFEVPAGFTFGNSGRGILRGDHQWSVDFSLFRRFTMNGPSALELTMKGPGTKTECGEPLRALRVGAAFDGHSTLTRLSVNIE